MDLQSRKLRVQVSLHCRRLTHCHLNDEDRASNQFGKFDIVSGSFSFWYQNSMNS